MTARKTTAGTLLALALLCAAALGAYWNIQRLIEARRWVEHTHRVLTTITSVVALTVDAETAARGYVITGDREYLAPLEAARTPLTARFESLRALTIDNAGQQRRLDEVEAAIRNKLEVVDALVTARTREGFAPAAAPERLTRGREIMDTIRSLAETLQDEERAELARREREAAVRTRRMIAVLCGATLLSAALLLTVVYLLQRELGRHRRTAAALRESEAALRENDERMNLALGAAQVGTWSWNIVADAIVWDPHIHLLFGIAPGTFPGRYDDAVHLVHPDDQERVNEEVRHAVDGDSDYATEFRVVWSDGSVHVLASRGRVYRDEDGRAVRMAGVCWDITERRRAEENLRERTRDLEAANASLNSFTYSVSHDLRAPLRAIDGYARILAEDHAQALDGEGHRVLGVVCENARQMGRLIDDLLAFSRLGRQELQQAPVDMAALARAVVDELQRAEPDRRVAVTIGSLPVALGDIGTIQQILRNLIGNAWKFTRGRAETAIEVGSTSGKGETIYFVRDNGAGFEMAYANKLFGVFQRLHRAEEFEGTGVGLAIVQRIVERHGGRVWAEGAVDRGATFYFTLPAVGGVRHGVQGCGDPSGRGQSGGRRARGAGASQAEPS